MTIRQLGIIEILLALLLPPAGVALRVRFRFPFWINIILTLIGYLPGVIHAFYIIMKEENA